MEQKDVFSRIARRRFFDRAVASDEGDRWLARFMVDELAERLSAVRRSFNRALIIGHDCRALHMQLGTDGTQVVSASAGFNGTALAIGVQCDEDRLPFADASFDLILAPGGLDTVNDLPGALILIRRILRADGLFLGAMQGAGGLATFRRVLAGVDGGNQAIVRHHPQIDVRAAGDLLARAGFRLPVAEHHVLTARYPNLFRLIGDLRANGMTNALVDRHSLTRDQIGQIAERFSSGGEDKTEENFSIIFMTGWAPTGA